MTTTAQSSLIPGGSGAGLVVRQARVLTSSETLIAPVTGKMMFMVQAPSGSGGAIDLNAATQRLATGGGAGEQVVDIVDVVAGQSYTFTHGVPGAGVGLTNTTANGNDATNCTVTGPNSYALTVVGGKKGNAASGVSTLAGGLGGTGGTGGTARVLRRAGSRGGNISNATGPSRVATGGGAPNPFDLPVNANRGGDYTSAAVPPGTVAATGGGGVGGRGGDLTSGAVSYTPGGGSGGRGADNATSPPGPNIRGDAATASPADVIPGLVQWMLDMFGGSTLVRNSNAGPGSGTAGIADTVSYDGGLWSAGNFGASAGVCCSSTIYSANPGFGAGSGAANGGGTSILGSAPGGKAVAVVYFLAPAS